MIQYIFSMEYLVKTNLSRIYDKRTTGQEVERTKGLFEGRTFWLHWWFYLSRVCKLISIWTYEKPCHRGIIPSIILMKEKLAPGRMYYSHYTAVVAQLLPQKCSLTRQFLNNPQLSPTIRCFVFEVFFRFAPIKTARKWWRGTDRLWAPYQPWSTRGPFSMIIWFVR